MNPGLLSTSADECFRCGYNLFGIADDQACPECGLLAIRSRRVTDELHETRPRWLKSIFWGLCLILCSVFFAFALPLLLPYFFNAIYSDPEKWPHGLFYIFDTLAIFGPAILLVIGVFCFTVREGYAPADRADHKRRLALRVAAFVPLAILLEQFLAPDLFYISYYLFGIYYYSPLAQLLVAELVVLVLAPLPPLLFLQLRNLAKRARCKYLPHDCLVVGFGLPIFAICTVGFEFATNNRQYFGLRIRGNSIIWLAIDLVVIILSIGFVLWTLYLLIYFANAFRKAAAEAKKKWIRDDLSLSHRDMPR